MILLSIHQVEHCFDTPYEQEIASGTGNKRGHACEGVYAWRYLKATEKTACKALLCTSCGSGC